MSSVVKTTNVSADAYLRDILVREAVDTGMRSPLRALEAEILSLCKAFGGRKLLEVYPTGAFEKGTANVSGIAIDFLASFSPVINDPTEELFEGLFIALENRGFEPVRRDVSVALMAGDIAVDIVPGKREAMTTDVHELWLNRLGRAAKSNLTQHILDTTAGSRRDEIRVLKIWRDQHGLDFPSFYLELSVIAALRKRPAAGLAENVWAVLGYLESLFPARSVLDPVNANNIVSDQLTAAGRDAVRRAAQYCRNGRAWSEIIR
jgi:hypothetical protein